MRSTILVTIGRNRSAIPCCRWSPGIPAREQFAKGPGCVKYLNIEAGRRMRAELDRQSENYKAPYRQRTAGELINSQATALGIERPRVHQQHSVRTLKLPYLVINARAVQ